MICFGHDATRLSPTTPGKNAKSSVIGRIRKTTGIIIAISRRAPDSTSARCARVADVGRLRNEDVDEWRPALERDHDAVGEPRHDRQRAASRHRVEGRRDRHAGARLGEDTREVIGEGTLTGRDDARDRARPALRRPQRPAR